jgi:hypothetical protein
MSAMTDYTEVMLANFLLRPAENVNRPTQLWVALHTASPGETAPAANEATYTGYARQQATFGAPVSGAGTCANTNVLTYPANTGSSQTVTHWSIFDAANSGNCIAHGSLQSSKAIDTNDVPSFPANSIILTFA